MRGEHFKAAGSPCGHAAVTVPGLGVATIRLIGKGFAALGSGLKAPVVSSRRRKVVMPVSRISLMFVFGTTPGSTPYFWKVSVTAGIVGGSGPVTAVAAGVLYGSAPS